MNDVKKSLAVCETCVYGANNNYCSVGKCAECPMHYEDGKCAKCKCLDVKWGEKCPNYVKEAK